MKGLFMTSPAPDRAGFSTAEKKPPLGTGILISLLKGRGHEITFRDEYLAPSGVLEGNFLETERPDFVGIYSNTICYQGTKEILYKLQRKRDRGSWKGKILVGGPHTSAAVETIPDFVDHIVVGEGEISVPKIVEGELQERVVVGEKVTDMDSLPRPSWEEFIYRSYDWTSPWSDAFPVYTMNTSRGCPFHCTFCSVNAVWGRSYRAMSAERVVADVEHMVTHYGAKGIFFREDHFTLDKRRTLEICELLLKRNIRVEWYCETRVDQLDDPEYQALMARAGCRAFYIGVESGSPRMLELFKKGETVDQFVRAFEIAHSLGIKTYASLVVGTPFETEEDLLLTEKLIDRIKPYRVGRNVYVGLPGSEIYERILREGAYEHRDPTGVLYPKGYLERVDRYYGGNDSFKPYRLEGAPAKAPFTPPVPQEKEPLVSVILPLSNQRTKVREALGSLKAQSYREWEAIVVEDGSEEGFGEVVREFLDPRISLFRQRNLGLGKAIEEGVKRAKGEYVAVLNGDDAYAAERLEVLTTAARERNLDALFTNISFMNAQGMRTDPFPGVACLGEDSILLDLLAGNLFVTTSNLFMKRGLFEKLGGFKEYRYAQDYDFLLRLCRECGRKIGYIDKPLLRCRVSGGGVFQESDSEKAWEVADILGSFLGETDPALLFPSQASREEKMARLYDSLKLCGNERWALVRALFSCHGRKGECAPKVSKAPVSGKIGEALSKRFGREELSLLRESGVALFGSGSLATLVFAFLQERGIPLRFVFDNDSKREGTLFGGVKVERPSLKEGVKVVVASQWEREISLQLTALGYGKEGIFLLNEEARRS